MTPDRNIDFRILRAIRRIIRRTSQHSRNVGRHGGVSVPQMLVLKSIAEVNEGGEATVAGIAQAVQLSAPTVSRILDRLENAGYILRTRTSKDRRKVCIVLTESGRLRIDDLPTPLHEQFLDRLHQLPADERSDLLLALERVVELMGAEGMDASPVLTPELNVDTHARQDNAPSADHRELEVAE
ncbi:MAG: MarR family transcriptional regulator [Planctomycetaceae bacterium]